METKPDTTENDSADIFERFGTLAKQFDALSSLAAQRDLTAGEKAFRSTFAAMLNGDATRAQMLEAHAAWMEEPARV